MKKSEFSRVEINTPWPKRDAEGQIVSIINFTEYVRVRRYDEEDLDEMPAIGDSVLCRLEGVECEMRVKAYEHYINDSLRVIAESIAEGIQDGETESTSLKPYCSPIESNGENDLMDFYPQMRKSLFKVVIGDEPIPSHCKGWVWTVASGTEEFEAERQRLEAWNFGPGIYLPGDELWCTVIDNRFCVIRFESQVMDALNNVPNLIQEENPR